MRSPRRYARIKAFQILFQMSSNEQMTLQQALYYAVGGLSFDEELENRSIEEWIAEKLSASPKIAEDCLNNIMALTQGTLENKDEIDAIIRQNLKQWRLERLDLVTLNLLRLGTFELTHDKDTSANIIMNEIIEMAKMFSDEQMSKFINGVLQGVVDGQRA